LKEGSKSYPTADFEAGIPMSFFNRFRSFSEWHNMDDHLEASLKAGVKRRAAFEAAQGRPFNEFARKQPEAVQGELFKIDGVLKEAQQSSKIAEDVIPKVRSELNRLRALNDDIKNKRKETEAVRDRSSKSVKNSDRAEAKLEQARVRNPSSPEFTKAQDEFDVALRQKQADLTALEERESQLRNEEREYKKQLFLVVTTAIEVFVNARLTACAGIAPLGAKISEIGKEIPDFVDPMIEVIQTQLQTLRSEPIE
jgi:chromosome segregation ATPase